MKKNKPLAVMFIALAATATWLSRQSDPEVQEKSKDDPAISRQVASNPVATPPPKNAKGELHSTHVPIQEWIEIEKCYRSNLCDFPQADPRSYGIEVGRKLSQKTAQLHREYRGKATAREDLGRLARFAFLIEDGFVQSAALDIFADLPPSEENLNTLNEGLKNNPDPLISEKALQELGRYMNTPSESRMQETVQSMLQGAHFASQKVSENILSFINDRSFTHYQDIQQRLPPGSRVARNLATALQEYRRQRTGG